jgi:hypothetical protein
MEIVGLARVLWRRRLLIAVGAVVAIAFGLAIGGAKPASTGFAHTRALVDTPKSQLTDNAPLGADSLTWRASLLAHLMATEANKQRLAQRVGIRRQELAVVDPALAIPEIASSLPKAASQLAGVTAVPYVLTVHMDDDTMPVISIEAVAPDRSRAARLAAAAMEILKEDVPPPQPPELATEEETESDAFRSDITRLQEFVVNDVGPIQSKTVVTGALPVKALGAAVFVFALWTAAIVLLPLLGPLLGRRGVGAERSRRRGALSGGRKTNEEPLDA